MPNLGVFMAEELRSQPEMWERTLNLDVPASALPQDGERIAVIGCGSSWFGSQVIASLRETLGKGETDAFTASWSSAGHPLAKPTGQV